MIDLFFLVVFLSLVVYRVGRFIVLDSLFDGIRERVFTWLAGRESWLSFKLLELLSCPFCVTVWISAAVVAITDGFISVPLPVWVWLAVAAGSLIPWRIVDWEDD